MDKWIFGFLMGMLSLLGLKMASNAQDAIFYSAGLIFFIFGVGLIFGLIHQATGSKSH